MNMVERGAVLKRWGSFSFLLKMGNIYIYILYGIRLNLIKIIFT